MGSDSENDGRLLVEDRLQGKVLQVLKKWMVKPVTETPIEKRWMTLSNLDRRWLPFYTPVLCIYKPGNDKSGEELVQHLRESLSEALVLFYPLAGRILTTDVPAPKIHCNDAGAVFVEASIDADLDELQYGDFQPLVLVEGMAEAGMGSYPTLPEFPTGRPALVVQVTHFKCGGITLAVNWAHAAADGFSGFHFLKSWAELARGAEVSLLPHHDRTLFKPRNPLIMSNPWPTGSESGQSQVKEAEKKHTKPQVKVIEFTKEDIERLKKSAEGDGSAGDYIRLSRVDCVSGHLWRTITIARENPSEDQIRSWTLVEGRKKLSLPAGYFGNVLAPTYATTTVSKLLKNPLSFSASLNHKAVRRITPDWFLDFVDWEEGGGAPVYPGVVLGADHECGFSWQNRFPYYELDLGFGAPVLAIRNATAAWDGFFVIVPSRHDPHGFAAMLHMPPDVMSKFLPLVYKFRDT